MNERLSGQGHAMEDMKGLPLVDAEKCIGCGQCVEICPVSLFTLQGGKATVSGTRCLACGHCEAVCLREAVVVSALDGDAADYETIDMDREWVPYGGFDPAALVSLMRSRRSCRHFLDTPVNSNILRDLVRIGATAPSGTNSQAWTFTVLSGRTSVLDLMEGVLRFFARLNRIARMPAARLLSKLGNGELDRYYRSHYEAVDRAIAEWEASGKDRLFFNAPAVILVGSRPGASTPAEDALLAAQNILLAAHAMGLGTCLIGFAAAALRRDHALRHRMEISRETSIHAVIAVGYTDRTFCRVTRRKAPETRIIGDT